MEQADHTLVRQMVPAVFDLVRGIEPLERNVDLVLYLTENGLETVQKLLFPLFILEFSLVNHIDKIMIWGFHWLSVWTTLRYRRLCRNLFSLGLLLRLHQVANALRHQPSVVIEFVIPRLPLLLNVQITLGLVHSPVAHAVFVKHLLQVK